MVIGMKVNIRDEEGKFTFKDLGNTLEGRIEKTNKETANLEAGIDALSLKEILLNVLGSIATPAILLYSTITQLKNMVKINKLEDKFNKALIEYKNNKTKDNNNNNNNNNENKVSFNSEQEKNRYRNKLLDILGDKATQADILYGKIETLEKKIKENGLQDKLSEVKKIIKQKAIQYAIGKNYKKTFNILAQNIAGFDAAGMLDLAHGAKMNDSSYIDNVVHINNYNDYKVEQDREYLKNKISQQFKDYNFDINKIKGYYFKHNSGVCERLVMNEDFRDILRINKEKIINNQPFSAKFKKYGNGFNKDSNFHNAFGKVDFNHSYFDNEGNLHIKMYDTYDFNKNENVLIQAGREEMRKGHLKPYFTICDIIVPKNILQNEIWKFDNE